MVEYLVMCREQGGGWKQADPSAVVALPASEAAAMRESIDAIVDLAQRTLDACTDFNAALGVGIG